MEKNYHTESLGIVYSSDVMRFLMMNTLGMSVLIEVLKMAKAFSHVADKPHPSNGYYHEAEKCFIFVQGTGLNMLVDKYSLGYDPEELKVTFNYNCGLRRYIKDE